MNSTANYRSVLILTLAATLTAGLILTVMWASAGPAGAQDEKAPPAKPSKMRITAEQGSLEVSLDWEDVESASRYRVRWRKAGPGNKLNAGIEVDSSDAVITVSDYGDWVVRVQACDDNGCGEPNARKFRVEPAPVPTPTPTPIPTPEPPPKPEPIPTPAPAPDLRVVIQADPPDPLVGQRVGFSASIYPIPPGSGSASFVWEAREDGGDWDTVSTAGAMFYGWPSAATVTFRLSVSYESGVSGTSEPLAVTWSEPTPERVLDPTPTPIVLVVPPIPDLAPMVDTHSANYGSFVGQQDAPPGTLVSKRFDGVFFDPNGDEMSYSVSVSENQRELVDELSVTLDEDVRTEAHSHVEAGAFTRVWFRSESDDEWKSVSPSLADPLTVAVTLTATDPGGLSSSVSGEFVVDWASEPEVGERGG